MKHSAGIPVPGTRGSCYAKSSDQAGRQPPRSTRRSSHPLSGNQAMLRLLKQRGADRSLKTKEANQAGRQLTAPASASVAKAKASDAQMLPAHLREKFQGSLEGKVDLGNIRLHVGPATDEATAALRARAFTHGPDIFVSRSEFSPGSPKGEHLLAHEVLHSVQQGGRSGAPTQGTRLGGPNDSAEAAADLGAVALQQGRRVPEAALASAHAPGVIQRKELPEGVDLSGPQDWHTSDREYWTQRWSDACYYNLMAADSSQYVRIVERRDFYEWFHNRTTSLGSTMRWALAATQVANGAHEVADLGFVWDLLGNVTNLSSPEFQGMMRTGNQVIFDNVLPKLRDLMKEVEEGLKAGKPITGPRALRKDMEILAEEQALIQPLYDRVSARTVDQLNSIVRQLGIVPIGKRRPGPAWSHAVSTTTKIRCLYLKSSAF